MNTTPGLYVVQITDADGVIEYEVDQAPNPLFALNTAVRHAVLDEGWHSEPRKAFSIQVTPVHRNTVPEKKWWKP